MEKKSQGKEGMKNCINLFGTLKMYYARSKKGLNEGERGC